MSGHIIFCKNARSGESLWRLHWPTHPSLFPFHVRFMMCYPAVNNIDMLHVMRMCDDALMSERLYYEYKVCTKLD